MSTSSTTRPATFEDWDAVSEWEHPVELVEGELVVNPRPDTRHGRAVVRLVLALAAYQDVHGGEVFTAPLGVRLSEDTVLEPDVLFLRPEQAELVRDDLVDGPPALVIEVSSPSTRRYDQIRKRTLYAKHGVAEFWFVDLDQERIEVSARRDGDEYGAPTVHLRDDRALSIVLDGFSVDVSEVVGEPIEDG